MSGQRVVMSTQVGLVEAFENADGGWRMADGECLMGDQASARFAPSSNMYIHTSLSGLARQDAPNNIHRVPSRIFHFESENPIVRVFSILHHLLRSCFFSGGHE